MQHFDGALGRRLFLMGLGAGVATLALPGTAQAKALGLGKILGMATDGALDKLAQPGAFYDDPDIRIGLPLVGNLGGGLGDALGGGLGGGLGGVAGAVLGAGQGTGLFDGLVRKLNDAAGAAAGEAKPIFRSAIDDLSFRDVPGIVSQNDGATRYLKQSAGDELHGKMRPLVDSALGDTGAYTQLDDLSAKHSMLSQAGLDRDGLGNWVTKQGLNGIFKYIGSEEAKLRANPLGKADGLLKGVIGK